MVKRNGDEVFWTRVFLFGASCVAGLIIARKRKIHRFHLHILSAKSHDFGRYFGMDIGGTLAKLVYFQPTSPHVIPHQYTATLNTEGCLSSIEAFILNLESRDGAYRDDRLELVVPQLGGTIHFLRYYRVLTFHNVLLIYISSSPTARIGEITDFVRHRFFHRYIKRISCTGGGAFKVSIVESFRYVFYYYCVNSFAVSLKKNLELR